ncbi:type IX secretion system protein PorG [Mucilaginibacter arboris]|uniref:Outer membrane beta-barrel protein n=1 Tax=Mucilaginibacter arboris TaxID=2682090 RepID=A0A7K1SUC5_9SPHI|nr:DUF6089 family protein [Mucilaginibacter arboris]MVN20921.1 outer membrane beta-barrel protein [Mucilaginibacter arboris]
MLMRKLFVLLFLLLVSFGSFAQKWEPGLFAGSSGYMGDFNQNNPLKFTDFSVGAFVKYNFSGYFSAKLGYTYGTIRGADSLSSNQQLRNRNLSFFSALNEVSLTGELNFFNYQPGISLKRWSPFMFAGVAVVNYNPKTVYQGDTYVLRPLKTEGQQKEYPYTAISIPYGVGVKVNFYKSWNLGLELGYRTAFTNYLDDVSGFYANKNSMDNSYSRALSDRSGEKTGYYIGSTGSQRGDLQKRDTYMIAGFTISYTFISQKCPVVQY